jgi:hypothetical protein
MCRAVNVSPYWKSSEIHRKKVLWLATAVAEARDSTVNHFSATFAGLIVKSLDRNVSLISSSARRAVQTPWPRVDVQDIAFFTAL